MLRVAPKSRLFRVAKRLQRQSAEGLKVNGTDLNMGDRILHNSLLLSIAIPTYNRNERVIDRLEEMRTWNYDWLEIIIVDNASANHPKIDSFSSINQSIRLVKNKINIGAPANVLKCIEEASGKFLWILSDDDEILPGALDFVKAILDSEPHVGLVSLGEHAAQQYTGASVGDFIAAMPSWSNQIILGNTIYLLRPLQENLHLLYHFVSSMCPQFTASLICITHSEKFLFCQAQVVKMIPLEPHIPQWSYLNSYQMFGIVRHTSLLKIREAWSLKRKIWKSLPAYKTFFFHTIKSLADGGIAKENMLNVWLNIFEDCPCSFKIKMIITLPIFMFPRACLLHLSSLVERFYGLKLRPVSEPY